MPSHTPDPSGDTASANPPILVVDDDAETCHMIRWALEEEGLTVETAADGQRGLELAIRRRPRLVILDMGLPLLNGAELAAKLRAAYGDGLPVLLITADGHVVEKARRVGAQAYLTKPFDLDTLCVTVQEVLGRG
ncbi:MAG TPA: response regulator transcription factor [Chloroflexota bacterium]|jgi:DNA-binding response OmpR family regulator